MENENSYKLQLEQFEGPLDLLLFLIKKNEVNIYDIPIAEITHQYLEYLEYATGIDLEGITEFYIMASTLLYIKSRMLLPVEINIDEELEDPRRELVDRLIEYQKFKKLTQLMENKEDESQWVISRKKKQRTLPFADDEPLWEKIEVWDLLKDFSKIMTSISSERVINLYEEVSISEKITLMEELLEDREDILFTDLLVNDSSIMEVVCAFLAVLESVKVKRISIYQNKLFGDIRITRYRAEEGDETTDGDSTTGSDTISGDRTTVGGPADENQQSS